MDIPIEFNRELAMEYFVAYAKYEKVYLDESIKLNNNEKIRGDVGAAELEYRDKEKLFIVRGLINKDISEANPTFKKFLLDTLFSLNNGYNKKFIGAIFEFDTTAYELQNEYPERINLRIDLHKPISLTEFVKTADSLMDIAYNFSLNDYRTITSMVNKKVFPSK